MILSRLFGARSAKPPPAQNAQQLLVVLIHDDIAGVQMGWGPEVDDLVARLHSVVVAQSPATCPGPEYRGGSYRLRFWSSDALLLFAAMAPILKSSPMAMAIEAFWSGDDTEKNLSRIAM
jgi:hypothetical protein